MDALQELLKRKWILRKEDPDLYNRVRDSVKEIRKFVQEKFGYMIILTPYLIKLEKIPGYVEEWMGIQEFQSVQEYQMFCTVVFGIKRTRGTIRIIFLNRIYSDAISRRSHRLDTL